MSDKTISFQIDGKTIEAKPGQTILEAATPTGSTSRASATSPASSRTAVAASAR
jgi:predicted molibdopterin-dependent oxidoreductase YjgC